MQSKQAAGVEPCRGAARFTSCSRHRITQGCCWLLCDLDLDHDHGRDLDHDHDQDQGPDPDRDPDRDPDHDRGRDLDNVDDLVLCNKGDVVTVRSTRRPSAPP